jgi:hypothetical protein
MPFSAELELLIRARYPLIYVQTSEELRVLPAVLEIAGRRGKKVFEWSCSTGIVPAGTSVQSQKTRGAATKDPLAALDLVLDQVEPAIFIFKDLHPFLARSNFAVIRKLKDIALHLKNSFKTLILVSPVLEIPAELEKEITVLNLPLPTRDELGELLERILADVRELKQVDLALDDAGRDRLLQAALGLTLGEAENVFAKIIVNDARLDGDDVDEVFAEKQQIIRKSGLLEYCAPAESFGHIGGMAVLKDWLVKRSAAFTAEARAFGLPAPKGVLLLGVQCEGRREPMAVAAAALRHGPDVWQPGRLVGGKRPPRHRRRRIGRAGHPVGGRDRQGLCRRAGQRCERRRHDRARVRNLPDVAQRKDGARFCRRDGE